MIWNLGSINADSFYRMAHLPAPGETVMAEEFTNEALGGKGANMSVAAARAGARVAHIGAVGRKDGNWILDRLLEYGVDIQHIEKVDQPTGHANIYLDKGGENSIVVYPGANWAINNAMIGNALTEASPGDILLMQNETGGQAFAAQSAAALDLRVIYAAAPFDQEMVISVLGDVDILVVNRVEADQLAAATGKQISDLGIADVIITLGEEGCDWVSAERGTQRFSAFSVVPVDTTGAGDTFTGYLAAALDRGLSMQDAITLASRAAALMVSRSGTADVIPDLKEVQEHDFG